jgi:hypothetical protein
MKSIQVAKFIAHIEKSDEQIFNLQYSKTHFVNMPKDKLLNYLKQDYANELCIEANRKMKMFGVLAVELLDTLNVNKTVFSYLMSGKLRSYKHIKDRVFFCKLIDDKIKDLC